MDVWEDEPNIDVELLEQVAIGTPHIAGYSFDGKVAGTKMLFDAVCKAFELDQVWDPAECLPPPAVPQIDMDAAGRPDQGVLRDVVRRVCDVEADDAQLRGVIDLPPDQRGHRFDQLRKTYPVRREFFNTCVTVGAGPESLRQVLRTWGFRDEPC